LAPADLVPRLKAAGTSDAVALVRRLFDEGACVPAAAHAAVPAPGEQLDAEDALAPGAGGLHITPGARPMHSPPSRETRRHPKRAGTHAEQNNSEE
jgi:hypothetical protein